MPQQQLQTRIDRLLAWAPPRRPSPIAWSWLSDDDLDVLERLACRAKALSGGQTFVATLDENEWARLERIAAKAGLEATV